MPGTQIMKKKSHEKKIRDFLNAFFFFRFLEEKNTYNFASNENPLHKSPITQYQNPAWEGNKKTM